MNRIEQNGMAGGGTGLAAVLAMLALIFVNAQQVSQNAGEAGVAPTTGPASRTGGADGAVCIDLSKHATAQLTNSLNSPDFVKENNLATFPKGRQMFQGLPFQISGVLQLTGKKIQEWGRREFPEAISGIEVGKPCTELYLLHGAGGVFDADGVAIGKLVLHYADGSVREMKIKNGVHVRDWWGDPKQAISAANSALVWTGSNPALKHYGTDKPGALRIYLTRFNNPEPRIAVTSVDYVSAMENSSPFMLGLTIR